MSIEIRDAGIVLLHQYNHTKDRSTRNILLL